ncbi:sulfurtransferase complex subunit TusC [Catenovulum sediminis]|uniref:Sulfurtransferase complex subunit TusC n=1 Tax=Catenovulum sediminis TaxID=1740262 RepID=A0ABV1RH52_9ALTE|nr:sulfurtransferase complex subunit TusC [Catenovulum sediminis]
MNPVNTSDNTSHAIIITSAPFENAKGQEALELALTLATFEQAVALFFSGSGLLQLLKSQNAELLKLKNYTDGFKALDLYDIEDVFIEQQSLADLHLNENDLLIETQALTKSEWLLQLANYNVILKF